MADLRCPSCATILTDERGRHMCQNVCCMDAGLLLPLDHPLYRQPDPPMTATEVRRSVEAYKTSPAARQLELALRLVADEFTAPMVKRMLELVEPLLPKYDPEACANPVSPLDVEPLHNGEAMPFARNLIRPGSYLVHEIPANATVARHGDRFIIAPVDAPPYYLNMDGTTEVIEGDA